LSTLIFAYSTASNSPLHQSDSDMTCSRSCDQWKITKRIKRYL